MTTPINQRKTTRARIDAAAAKIEKAKRAYDDVVRREQARCKHSNVFERESGVTKYSYIENRYFPGVKVCADCGLIEEKDRMTPLYNTYENEKRPRLKCEAIAKVDEAKLSKLAVRLA